MVISKRKREREREKREKEKEGAGWKELESIIWGQVKLLGY